MDALFAYSFALIFSSSKTSPKSSTILPKIAVLTNSTVDCPMRFRGLQASGISSEARNVQAVKKHICKKRASSEKAHMSYNLLYFD